MDFCGLRGSRNMNGAVCILISARSSALLAIKMGHGNTSMSQAYSMLR